MGGGGGATEGGVLHEGMCGYVCVGGGAWCG